MTTPTDPDAAAPGAPAPSTGGGAAGSDPTRHAVATSWEGVAEQFARDWLRDRRSARRWRVFYRASWLLILLAVGYVALSTHNRSTLPTGPHTALIEVRGEIAAGAEASAENLVPGIKSAFEDDDAKAIVAYLKSIK